MTISQPQKPPTKSTKPPPPQPKEKDLIAVSALSGLIDDDIILATDEQGLEKLVFWLEWDGSRIWLRYPKHGQWDRYCQELGLILDSLSRYIGDLEIPDLTQQPKDMDGLTQWRVSRAVNKGFWELAAELLRQKKVAKRIEDLFWKYLNPHIDGMTEEQARDWIGENMPLGAYAEMLIALMKPEEFIKKKVLFLLQKNFPQWTKSSSGITSSNSADGQKKSSLERPSFASG